MNSLKKQFMFYVIHLINKFMFSKVGGLLVLIDNYNALFYVFLRIYEYFRFLNSIFQKKR